MLLLISFQAYFLPHHFNHPFFPASLSPSLLHWHCNSWSGLSHLYGFPSLPSVVNVSSISLHIMAVHTHSPLPQSTMMVADESVQYVCLWERAAAYDACQSLTAASIDTASCGKGNGCVLDRGVWVCGSTAWPAASHTLWLTRTHIQTHLAVEARPNSYTAPTHVNLL